MGRSNFEHENLDSEYFVSPKFVWPPITFNSGPTILPNSECLTYEQLEVFCRIVHRLEITNKEIKTPIVPDNPVSHKQTKF